MMYCCISLLVLLKVFMTNSKVPFRRITVSLPCSVASDLDAVSLALSVSRSALLSGLLCQFLPQLRDAVLSESAVDLGFTSNSASEGVLRRYRSSNKDLLDRYINAIGRGHNTEFFTK